MSAQDNKSMSPIAPNNTTAVGESSTTSHIDSTQNTLRVKIKDVGLAYDLWLAGLQGHAEIRPIPNRQYSRDKDIRKACWKNRTSVELGNSDSRAQFIKAIIKISQDPKIAHTAVCLGICPRSTALRGKWNEKESKMIWIGGRSEDVTMYPGVVYDLDDHSAEDGESLPHGAEMLRELSQKGADPTFKVKSGGGRGEHGYYRFYEPVDVPTGNRIIRKLARLLRSDIKITDPSHVMRIPGTWNTKTGSMVPVTIFDVTRELCDPIALETAIDIVARENGIDLSDDYTRPQIKPESQSEWPKVEINEVRRITEVCARMAYYATPEGANSMSYWEWFGMATVLYSLNPDDSSYFEELSRLYDGHNDKDIHQKWLDVRNTKPVSCAWFQAIRPLPQCNACPFFQENKVNMNPALALRMMLKNETGDARRYFPAPKPSVNIHNRQAEITREMANKGRGEASMEALQAENEVAAGVEATAPEIDVMEDDYENLSLIEKASQVFLEDDWIEHGKDRPSPYLKVEQDRKSETVDTPVIDVTEDDEESNTATDNTEQQTKEQQPNFRLVADNITPLIEQCKVYEEKLRNGTDGHDIMHEVARLLAEIKKLDTIRYDVEKDRFISAENAGKKRGQYKYTNKKLDDAVKAFLEREATELTKNRGTVGEYWPDAPSEHHHLPVAEGFSCSEEGVSKVILVGNGIVKEEVSGQPVYVAAPRLNIGTGETHVVIMHRTRYAGWQEITELPSVATNPNTVRKLADQSLSVLNASHMAEYINKCNDLVVNTFGEAPGLQTERLGLHIEGDDVAFVWPDKSVGAKQIRPAPQSGTRSFMDNYLPKGNELKELNAVFGVLKEFPKTAFAFGVMAAAFLVRAANESQVIEFFGFCAEIVSAKTTIGKSKTLNFAIAPWANPSVIRPLDGTSFAVGEVLYAMSDLPVAFVEAQQLNDNTKGTADAQRIIHALGDGGTRMLGAKNGGLRNSNQLHSTFMMANNASVLPDSADDGPRARLLPVRPLIPPGGDSTANAVDSYAQLFARNHGHGGRALVEGFLTDCGWSWEKFMDKVEVDLKKEIAEIKVPPLSGDIARRVNRRRKLVGLARVGFKYLIHYAYPDFEQLPAEHLEPWFAGIQDVFDELVEDERKYERENNTSLRLLDRIGDWVQSELGKVRGCEPKRMVGESEQIIIPSYYIGALTDVNEVKCIGLYKMRLEDFVNGKYKKSLRALIPEWEEAEILVKDKNQTTRKINKVDPALKKPFGKLLVFSLESLGLGHLGDDSI